MDLINNLSLGFGVAFTFQNLIYGFIGCLLGTLIGVLPGIGPVATIAMLLPATYALPPIAALIMLAGITTAPNTVVRLPPFWSTCPVSLPPWSPSLTATKWPAKAGRGLRSLQLV